MSDLRFTVLMARPSGARQHNRNPLISFKALNREARKEWPRRSLRKAGLRLCLRRKGRSHGGTGSGCEILTGGFVYPENLDSRHFLQPVTDDQGVPREA